MGDELGQYVIAVGSSLSIAIGVGSKLGGRLRIGLGCKLGHILDRIDGSKLGSIPEIEDGIFKSVVDFIVGLSEKVER